MDLDTLWEHIFSEDDGLIRHAWNGLSEEERQQVRALLERITRDSERIEAQRVAAQFALSAIRRSSRQLSYATAASSSAVGQFVELPAGALDFARELARETGLYLKTTFGHLTASLKRDGTLVTESDLNSDQRLTEAILKRYPQHGILSEEHEKIYRGQEWCWVIDPIDGTTNFTWGFPVWGVLIGLLHSGDPLLGVADFPVTNEQYYAVRGGGAWLNDMPIRTANVLRDSATAAPELLPTQLFACCTRTLKHGRLNLPTKIRVAGATGYDLALIAKGACIGCLNMVVHVWDIAALWPIVKEAGGHLETNMPVNMSGNLFPLRTGLDYGSVEFSALAACDSTVFKVLSSRLSDRVVFPSQLPR